MGSSASRKQQRAATSQTIKAARNAARKNGGDVELAKAADVNNQFRQLAQDVSERFDQLGKVINDNVNGVRNAFMLNDNWFHTLRYVVSEQSRLLIALAEKAGVETTLEIDERNGMLKFDAFWEQAQKDLNEQRAALLEAQAAAAGAIDNLRQELDVVLDSAPADEEPVSAEAEVASEVEFGGDYNEEDVEQPQVSAAAD